MVEPLSAEVHGGELWRSVGQVRALWTHRRIGPFETADAFTAFLRAAETDPAARHAVFRDRNTGRAEGMSAYTSLLAPSGSLELGPIMLGPAISRTAAATEALVLQIDRAFALGYRRVEWTADPLNAPSMRAATRLGFSFEALFRHASVSKGRNRDKAVFAITDAAWPPVRETISAWLSPDNFTCEGQQRTRLSEAIARHLSARAPAPRPAPCSDLDDRPTEVDLSGWSPPPAPTRGRLEGRFARLEPLTLDHAGALHAANREDRDGEMWRWLPYGPFASLSAYRDWVADAARAPDPLFFAISADGTPLGVASFLRISPAHGSVEIGHICLAPRLQRSPAATDALALMMGWAFDAGYRRLEWKCNAENARSRRAAGRLGLSFEGVTRQASVSKGANRDTAWYAATDAEWPAIRSALDTWLDPANFDTEGRQRRRLSDLTRPLLRPEG